MRDVRTWVGCCVVDDDGTDDDAERKLAIISRRSGSLGLIHGPCPFASHTCRGRSRAILRGPECGNAGRSDVPAQLSMLKACLVK